MSQPGGPGDPEPRHEREVFTRLSDDHDDVDVAEAAEGRRSRAGAMITAEERPALIEAMGGPLGMAEASIPSVAFIVAYTAGSEVRTAAIIAVAFAALFAVARLARRQTIQFAISGVIGVAFSAWVATKTGEARGYFIPGFFVNLAYLAAAAISVAVGRPFIGYVAVGLAGNQGDWRRDPVKMRAFRLASLVWVGLFVLRLVVQVPLYLADEVVALGTVKLAMSYPLFGVGIWLSWRIVRPVVHRAGPDGGDDRASGEPGSPPPGAPPAVTP